MSKRKKNKKRDESAPKQVAPRRYRDALTGRFVSKKYAKKHRKTTVKEATTSL